MAIFFYVHNSNGKDSLDLWPCSQQTEEGGGGEGRVTASYHVYTRKTDPSSLAATSLYSKSSQQPR